MQSDRWCRLRADVFGRPLRRMAARHAAALGAAVCAGVGCGAMASLAEAAAGLVRPDATFDPGPGTALADDRFATSASPALAATPTPDPPRNADVAEDRL